MLRQIKLIFGAALVLLCVVSCGKEETQERVSQKDTQTTNVISGSAVNAISSETIKTKKYLPVSCQEKDEKYEKQLQSGDYTWEKPLVVQNPYGNSPLTAYILLKTSKLCKVRVTVKGKDKDTDLTGTLEKTKEHRIPVVGLYPDYKNEVEISCLDEKDKVTESQVISIKTEKLPDALKDALKVEKQSKKSAYGLTVISGQTTKYPFAYDQKGEIRWYITMTTGSYGVFPLSDQRLIFQTNEALTPTEEKPHTTQMYEMDYLGRAYRLYYVKNGIHHEVIEKEPGGNLFLLSSSIDGHTEDVVQEMDRQTGEIIQSLDMREIFDETYEDMVDWVHLNTVSYNKEDDTVLLSPRNIHSAVKVGWKDKKIKWILTNPDMFKGTKQEKMVLKPQGDITWHFQQHSVYEIPYDLDGNPDTRHIMLYDNHWQTKRKVDFFDGKEQSFVSVYVVDEKKMTVRQDKLFPGVRSIITSNCAYDKQQNRMFSFGGYLHPLINGQKGMIYEFDYSSGELLNQYSTKYYFYRGYGIGINWNDLAQPLEIGDGYVKGTLQAPVESKESEVPGEKMDEKKAGFTLIESVLYMKTSDHAISKVSFVGQSHHYLMDYTSAGKGMKSKRNQKYSIAIPLSGLQPDTYRIAVYYDGKWCDTGKEIMRNQE